MESSLTSVTCTGTTGSASFSAFFEQPADAIKHAANTKTLAWFMG
jgi:hypothetical protein